MGFNDYILIVFLVFPLFFRNIRIRFITLDRDGYLRRKKSENDEEEEEEHEDEEEEDFMFISGHLLFDYPQKKRAMKARVAERRSPIIDYSIKSLINALTADR